MNQNLADELLSLQRRDAKTRALLLKQGKLYGEYNEEMQHVHTDNAKRLNAIVSAYGWPGIALAGLEGSRAAWLVAQHAISAPDLQRRFLALLKEAADRGDAPLEQLAFLTDRIRFNEERPQVYGTVLDWNANGELSCDVEDPDALDARRKAIGLAPFAEDLEKHKREVESEGGRPPEDFNAYRKKRRAWAKTVGWL